MKIQRENKQQEYETIVKREKELEEMIYHAILPEYYEEWTELMKTKQLRYSIEVKCAYERGVKKGAYYQRIIQCE